MSMTAASPTYTLQASSFATNEPKTRYASHGKGPAIFTDIYHEETNIIIWQRELSETLKESVDNFLTANPTFQLAMTVTPQSVRSSVYESVGATCQTELVESIAELVDMFCCLFELKRAGLRLTALDRAMCPKFHVDKVPCRLVTTFQGVATEWLPHQQVNRDKLGAGSHGLPDNESGLYSDQNDIQQLSCGDVALLKGEIWPGNENAGLVHRSPALPAGKNRLLLTLDFSD